MIPGSFDRYLSGKMNATEVQRQRGPLGTGSVKEAVTQEGETTWARPGGPTGFWRLKVKKDALQMVGNSHRILFSGGSRLAGLLALLVCCSP